MVSALAQVQESSRQKARSIESSFFTVISFLCVFFEKFFCYLNSMQKMATLHANGWFSCFFARLYYNEKQYERRRLTMAASGKKRYLYAVVNSAMMTARDMDAVEQYLNGLITKTPVLLDVFACRNARDVYSLLSREADCRGGTTAGVQLFGTADMVKAFEIQYKVQLTAGVKTDEPLCTDLFYGNFSNPPEMPWEDYNVREHFL